MKRTLAAALLTAALAASAAVPAAAAERTVPVQVDGAELETVNYLENGVTYVPLRALLDAFGGWELHWDSAKRQAAASSGAMRLTADPAADSITVNGIPYAGRVTVRGGRDGRPSPARLPRQTQSGQPPPGQLTDGRKTVPSLPVSRGGYERPANRRGTSHMDRQAQAGKKPPLL